MTGELHLTIRRHGRSRADDENVHEGTCDSPLTPAGEAQAAALATYWQAHPPGFDRAYTSTLARAHDTARIVGAGTYVKQNDAGKLDLTPQQQQALFIDVQPNSMIGEDGLPATTGQIGISVVPPELVEGMLPPGLLKHTFDITVQAQGFTNFSAPAPMSFPNVFDAAPGTARPSCPHPSTPKSLSTSTSTTSSSPPK